MKRMDNDNNFATALIFVFWILLPSCFCFGQMDTYKYQREISITSGVPDNWVGFMLPNAVYAKAKRDQSDVRVYEVTIGNDTIETPFVIRQDLDSQKARDIGFTKINESSKNGEYYYTFKIDNEVTIDNLDLDFEESNFDYRVKLEGGQTLDDMAVILENYRILSFVNNPEDYTFSTLKFGKSEYKYYKLTIPSKTKVRLKSAKFAKSETILSDREAFITRNQKVSQDQKNLTSVIEIALNGKRPITTISLEIGNPDEYYRPLLIEGLVDSVETQKGWRKNYRKLYRGTLSSLEDNKFNFTSSIYQDLRITIKNYNSPPLKIGDVTVSGVRHQVLTKLRKDGKYYLCYGNKKANKPRYDLQYFKNDLPESFGSVSISKESIADHKEGGEVKPLLMNKWWLWILLIGLVVLLGGATLNMLKKES